MAGGAGDDDQTSAGSDTSSCDSDSDASQAGTLEAALTAWDDDWYRMRGCLRLWHQYLRPRSDAELRHELLLELVDKLAAWVEMAELRDLDTLLVDFAAQHVQQGMEGKEQEREGEEEDPGCGLGAKESEGRAGGCCRMCGYLVKVERLSCFGLALGCRGTVPAAARVCKDWPCASLSALVCPRPWL